MSAKRAFVLACPSLGISEEVEADGYADAIAAIRWSGAFDEAFGAYIAGGGPEAMFQDGFLETHVIDRTTRETATFELRASFVLVGYGDEGDHVTPKAVGE